MEQSLTWNIGEFIKICNQCLYPNYTVSKHFIRHHLGDKTTFNLKDFRHVCSPTLADKFIMAKLRAKRELEEAKAERQEAQQRWRAEYSKQWRDAHPNYLPNWEKGHTESKKKRNRKYYLKKKFRDGIISLYKYKKGMKILES